MHKVLSHFLFLHFECFSFLEVLIFLAFPERLIFLELDRHVNLVRRIEDHELEQKESSDERDKIRRNYISSRVKMSYEGNSHWFLEGIKSHSFALLLHLIIPPHTPVTLLCPVSFSLPILPPFVPFFLIKVSHQKQLLEKMLCLLVFY